MLQRVDISGCHTFHNTLEDRLFSAVRIDHDRNERRRKKPALIAFLTVNVPSSPFSDSIHESRTIIFIGIVTDFQAVATLDHLSPSP